MRKAIAICRGMGALDVRQISRQPMMTPPPRRADEFQQFDTTKCRPALTWAY